MLSWYCHMHTLHYIAQHTVGALRIASRVTSCHVYIYLYINIWCLSECLVTFRDSDHMHTLAQQRIREPAPRCRQRDHVHMQLESNQCVF